MRKTGLILLASFAFLLAIILPGQANAEDRTGRSGRKWAVCIGVSRSANAKLLTRTTAARDASKIAAALEEHGDFDQIFVLADDVSEKDSSYPSRLHIQKLLNQLASRLRKDDTVLFSYSGIGATDEAGRGFLLAADSRAGQLEETAIPLDGIFDMLKKASVQKSILLIDAVPQNTSGGSAQGVYPDRYMKKGASAIFYAAAKGYGSEVDENSRHSVFAKNLIVGLQGEADRQYGGNKDGVVTLRELASFVNLALAEWRAQAKGRQVPFIEMMDQGQAEMRISSAEKVRTAKPRHPGWAVAEMASGRKKPLETRAAQEKTGTTKEVVPEDGPKERSAGISVRAPAPGIDDLVKEAKPSSTANQEAKASPGKPAKRTEPQDEVKVRFSERSPKQAENPVSTKRAEKPVLAAPEEELKPALEKEKTGVVPPRAKEAARTVSTVPGMRQDPVTPSMAQVERKRMVRLRAKPKEVSAEELKSILVKHGFYSTCWNYNGDFCHQQGDFENHFSENGDGTVSDAVTGLMWQKGGSDKVMAWASAKEYMERVNRERFAGYSDWRMPTVEEMASLIESSWKNGDLFIDSVFDRAQRQCWTLDTKGMDSAWKVNFHQGFLMDFPVEAPNSVRLVRTQQ